MTRAEILALEGEALWGAACEALDIPDYAGRGFYEVIAFAILRAVREWSSKAQVTFESELDSMIYLTGGFVSHMEPHHIARAALLAQVKP